MTPAAAPAPPRARSEDPSLSGPGGRFHLVVDPSVAWYHPDRYHRWARRGVLVALFLTALALRVGPAAGILIGFAVLTPIERIWKRHDQPVRRKGLRADMLHVVLTGVLIVVLAAVPVLVLFMIAQPFAITPLRDSLGSMPAIAQIALALVIFDLAGYWVHRWGHTVPFLWRFHAVHHSSEALDWIAGARRHPVGNALTAMAAVVPLVVLGLDVLTIGALGVVIAVTGLLLHANVRWRLKWLDGKWATPEFHHWHHANEEGAIDHNYAGALPIWDRLFGTYFMPDGRRPQVYGIDEPMADTYVGQLVAPFRGRQAGWEAF